MTDVTIVCWRDIPAQVMVGSGRRAARSKLPERFEQAIDRCAMKIGARDSDGYMDEWRKAVLQKPGREPRAAALEVANNIDKIVDAEELKGLIRNDGWSVPSRAYPWSKSR